MTDLLHSTVPLYFLVPNGNSEPETTKRINAEDSLNIDFALSEVAKQTIHRTRAGNSSLSVVNAVAPYSRLPHVMVMDTTPMSYKPTFEFIEDDAGEKMMRMCAAVIHWGEEHFPVDSTNVGFNSGPLSFGSMESGGAQSFLSKVHLHIFFKEPPPETGMKTTHNHFSRGWISASDLSPQQKRLLFENSYGEILGRMIGSAIREQLPPDARSARGSVGLFDHRRWRYDARGLVVPFDGSVKDLFSRSRFFADALKPIATATEQLFRELTEALTDMDCPLMTQTLQRCEQGPLSAEDLAFLRRTPTVRPEQDIRASFERHGWPLSLLDCLLPAVRARCGGGSEPSAMWRRGFSYCAVFRSDPDGEAGELRIMPIVYLGPAGVFEATWELLTRLPQPAPLSELRLRGRELAALGNWLRGRVG